MVDLFRLVALILLLPLIIILLGPLLVLAAIRGQQYLGPITLNSTRYNFAGRIGVFLLGIALWLLVWGGLTWLAVDTFTPAVNPPDIATFTPVAPPTATGATLVTAAPPTKPATVTANPTSIPTSTLAIKLTAAPKSSPVSTVITGTPAVTLTAVVSPVTPTRSVTATTAVTSANRQAALAVVEEANNLLKQAISQSSQKNLDNLGRLWQADALVAVQKFVAHVTGRFTEPPQVTLEYLNPPAISAESAGQVVIVAGERWTYGGDAQEKRENFEFTYTVVTTRTAWVISQYSYRRLPEEPVKETATALPR